MDSNETPDGSAFLSRRLAVTLVIFIGLVLASLQAWRSIYEAVFIPGVSDFLRPLLWFSLVTILFGLECVLIEKKVLQVAAALLVFIPSFLFALNPGHFPFICVSSLLAWFSMYLVQGELKERIHFSIYKGLRAGLTIFLLGLTLAISSQYYVHAQSLSWEQLISNFQLSERNSSYLFRTIGRVYHPVGELENREVTVDAFLRTVGEDETVSSATLTPELVTLLSTEDYALSAVEIEQSVQIALLERKRENLSKLVGRRVEGDEKMSAVLTEVLRKKALNLIDGTNTTMKFPVPLIPAILASLLFLSVYPIAALLLFLWVLLIQLCFMILRRSRLVSLYKVVVEQERLGQ